MKHPDSKKFIIQKIILTILLFNRIDILYAQNSLTGDGFGGRSWYVAHNYQVGSYGAYTVCGTDDQLYAWGGNDMGELGNGTTTPSYTPVMVSGMNNVKFYTSGYISAVIKKDSTAWAWGYLTNNTGNQYAASNPLFMLSDVKFADGGISHLVFVKYNGTVWAVGKNNTGQLGDGTTNFSTLPVQMTGVNNAVRAISIGYGNGSVDQPATLILCGDKTVKITGGYSTFSTINSTVPIVLPGLNNIIDIKATSTAAFALNTDGEVYSFGRNAFGILGLGLNNVNAQVTPTRITFPAGAAPIIALSANVDGVSAMALDENGNVYGWGENFHGQLGDGTNLDRKSPVLVASNVIDIYAGETFSYILKSDNTLWATGKSGQTPPLDGSIWMNLANIERHVFTQLSPTIPPMSLCEPKVFGVICPYKVDLGIDTTLCDNQKLILGAGISNAGYLWQDNSVDSIYTVSSPGTYSVTVSKFNCIMKDTINIYYKPLPTVALGNDSILCKSEKLNLHMPDAGATYVWQDNSTSQNYTITEPGSYWVNVELNGCHNTDTIVVGSKYCNCTLNVPNAITPNGDGINDKWVFTDQGCFRYVDVLVYNRYGNLVYEKKNYQNDWEGTYKLKPLPDGTYYYIIKTTRIDGKIENLKGNLTILR